MNGLPKKRHNDRSAPLNRAILPHERPRPMGGPLQTNMLDMLWLQSFWYPRSPMEHVLIILIGRCVAGLLQVLSLVTMRSSIEETLWSRHVAAF